MHCTFGLRIFAAALSLLPTLTRAVPDQVRVRFRLFEIDAPRREGFAPLRDRLSEEPTDFLSVVTVKCVPGKIGIKTRAFRREWVASMLSAKGIRPSAAEMDALARQCSTKAMVNCTIAPDNYTIGLAVRWEATVPDASRSETGKLAVAEHVIETDLLLWDGEAQIVRFPGGRGGGSRYLAVDVTLYDTATGKPVRALEKGAPAVLAARPAAADAAGREPADAAAPARQPKPISVHVQLLRMPGDVDLGTDGTFEELREAARKEPAKRQGELSAAIRRLPASKKQYLYPLSSTAGSGHTSTCQWGARIGDGKKAEAGSAEVHATAVCAADMYTIDLQLIWNCEIPGSELRGTQRDASYHEKLAVKVWDNERLFIPLGREGANTVEFLVVSASLVNPNGLPVRPHQLR